MKKLYFLVMALCFFTATNAQIINIPDPNFKAKLLEADSDNNIAYNIYYQRTAIDMNGDGEIDAIEAQNIIELDVNNSSISDLTGIAYFTNLKELTCANNTISILDMSVNPELEILRCYNNFLTSLNVNNNTLLKQLDFSYNNIAAIDLSNNTALTKLSCHHNSLLSLDISNNLELDNLDCSSNSLTELDVSHNLRLVICSCHLNPIRSLDFSANTLLGSALSCGSSVLEYLNVKNGIHPGYFTVYGSGLKYICVDEEELSAVQAYVTSNGYTDCVVNTYCSFTPGGEYFTVNGQIKYDHDNNGCDNLDINPPGMRFSITNGANSVGTMITNSTGSYSLPLDAGVYTIQPDLENLYYFNIQPSVVNVNFPSQTSLLEQNFCITANGVHPDLEVVLTPVLPARPGFDAVYRLIYKNKGNQTQSGTVNFVFNDAVLDVVSTNPAATTQTTNNLSWNFTNLKPFDIKDIDIKLNVNSPVETPAVNGGDILNFTASITTTAIDETPNDNTFTLNQIVVNSFDPNDKTCLEGTVIPPAKVGDYIHYTIRFENTGTYPAQNIVVKDMIDLSKFDINTLVPIKASHPFVTRISNTNNVEFIFENINLPFDDANNDGYITFKIKTKPTLVLGNTFSNSASIYFDYNHPIITNTATTTIQALNTKDFEFSNYFSLYPNPVKDNLSIVAKSDIEISSISIYNTLGQQVLVVTNAQNTKAVDVSNLPSGNYFVKINSNKGSSNTKFIKS